MKSFFIENLEIKYIIYRGRLLFKAPKLEGFLTPYQIKNLNEEHGFTLNSEAENEVLFKEGGRGIYLYQNFFFFKIILYAKSHYFLCNKQHYLKTFASRIMSCKNCAFNVLLN